MLDIHIYLVLETYRYPNMLDINIYLVLETHR